MQKYSNLLNDSFNNINRSNSVKSNLSDNVTYNNQNRKMNYNLNLNLQSHNLNYQNMNHFNNFNQNNLMPNNKINPNFNQKNMISYSPNHSNAGNINYMPNQMSNVQHHNNSMNIGNFNNMMNYNSNKNIQFGRVQNNNQAQHRFSSNSITNVHQLDYAKNRLNHSGNLMNNLNNNKNIWGFPNQYPYQNNISPNNSMAKGSFSDNELNENQFLNSNNSRNNYRSFSSHFSNSSSDQLNESLKYEKDYEMILGNPDDDSIDMNEMDNSNNKKYVPNGAYEQFYGKNDLYYIEKIENTNNFLKELIKEGESNLNNDYRADLIEQNFVKEENLNKDNFLFFLKKHKFNYLYNLISEYRIILNDLVRFSDERIMDLIEEENKPKAYLLIEVLMKFDEKLEGDDVMESLNNLDFK